MAIDGVDYSIGQGMQALDLQAMRDRMDGYAVVSGLTVSPDTGMDLTVSAGEAIMGETNGSVDTVTLGSDTTVSVGAADSTYPRKDVVYLAPDGTPQVEAGVPQEALPDANTRFETYQPSPPDMSAVEGVVLAEVWVAAGTSSIGTDDIRDRRMPAKTINGTGSFTAVNVEEDLSVGGLDIHSEAAVSVSVPTDYSTIQEAVDDVVPLLNDHNVTIEVTDDTNEDLYLDHRIPRRVAADTDREDRTVLITGDGTYPTINSGFIDTWVGMGLGIEGLTVAGDTPFSDESAAIEAYGCPGRVQVTDLQFTGTTTYGVVSYSSNVTFSNSDMGSGITDAAVAKHEGSIRAHSLSGEVDVGVRNVDGVTARLMNAGNLTINQTEAIANAGPAYYEDQNGDLRMVGPAGPRNGWEVQKELRSVHTLTFGQDAVSVSSGAVSTDGNFGKSLLRVSAGDGSDLETVNLNDGQKITLIFNDSITVRHNTADGNLLLDGSADATFGSGDTLTLVKRNDVVYAHEVGRMQQ